MTFTAQQIIDRRKQLWAGTADIERDREFITASAEYLLTDKAAAVRKEIANNPELLIEMFFTIVDKDLQTVPFMLNDVQRTFLADVAQARRDFETGARNSVKFLILKGRQQGFTSAITGYQLACSIITKNFSGFTLADVGNNTNTIFEDKARYVYNALPDPIKPAPKYNNRREFHFEKLNSRWRVDTAGNKEVGRSKTINFFHGSEAAFWDSIESVMAGLGEALTKGSIQILETTANGLNEFKDLWDAASKGRSNWEPKFYQWWLTKEYRSEFEDHEREQRFKADVLSGVTDFHKKLKLLLDFEHLEWEQLYWYAGKHKDLGDKLAQEYPCTADEAFLASGRPRFDVSVLMEYLQHCVPGQRGELVYSGGRGLFMPDEKGRLEIWQPPVSGREYFIGADVAKGLAGGDYSAAPVFDANKTLVALWHGHIEPDEFGHVLIALGTYYNDALVAPEENNHGLATINAMKNHYHNIYKRTTTNRVTDEERQELGFWTDNRTKPLMIDNLATLIKQRAIGIKSKLMIQEYIRYVVDDKGKTNASSGNDDTVTASAIILLVMDAFVTEVPTIVSTTPDRPLVPTGADWMREFEGGGQTEDDEWYGRGGW